MVEVELIRAQRYHEQAQRLSALASGEKKETLRAKLLELAAQYEDSCRRIVSRQLKKPRA